MNSKVFSLKGGLIVSCQPHPDSPLNHPFVIGALAASAQWNGAVAVRIDGPRNIKTVKKHVDIPVIGLHKVGPSKSPVYITPTYAAARSVAASGADIVALDATHRPRPNGERLPDLITAMKQEFGVPVLADVSNYEEGMCAAEYGADLLATTLCGYTEATRQVSLPAFDLVRRLAAASCLPVVCEGGVATPDQAVEALRAGAFAVVVGRAITGIDESVRRFVASLNSHSRKDVLPDPP